MQVFAEKFWNGSHGGHGDTEEYTFVKISGRGTEGTEENIGWLAGKAHAEAQRAQRGSRVRAN